MIIIVNKTEGAYLFVLLVFILPKYTCANAEHGKESGLLPLTVLKNPHYLDNWRNTVETRLLVFSSSGSFEDNNTAEVDISHASGTLICQVSCLQQSLSCNKNAPLKHLTRSINNEI